MSYGRERAIQGSGMAIGQQAQAMNMCSAPAPEIQMREIEAEMNILNSATEELGRSISELDDRLTPVLRQIPVGETSGKPDEACSSPLGHYLADKTAAMRHLTRRVQSILERLAV